MPDATGKQYSVGMRFASIFALNANGSPAAVGVTAYEGVRIVGTKAFTLNISDPRKFTHLGDDNPIQVDYLPPTEAASAEISVSRDSNDVYALATGTNQVDIGESKVVGIGTSQQGSEPQVCLLAYQQSLDENGARNYRWFMIPKATLYPKVGGMSGDAVTEHSFTVSPAVVSKYPWETAFSLSTEGFLTSQILKGQSIYKPKLIAFLAGVSTTEFVFPTDYPAQSTDKIVVWVDGVEQTSGITPAVDKVTFATAPGTNKRVVIFYEHE